jgi:hypothetical protein
VCVVYVCVCVCVVCVCMCACLCVCLCVCVCVCLCVCVCDVDRVNSGTDCDEYVNTQEQPCGEPCECEVRINDHDNKHNSNN